MDVPRVNQSQHRHRQADKGDQSQQAEHKTPKRDADGLNLIHGRGYGEDSPPGSQWYSSDVEAAFSRRLLIQ
jgi:hypothetical protein